MSEPTFRSTMHAEIVDHMGNDLSPVRAARVSTGTTMVGLPNAEKDLRLLHRLFEDGHHVPFETQVVTFYIEAPIFVTRQLLKHRMSSISETSGRYREMPGQFYVPSENRAVKQVGKTMDYEFEHDADLSMVARSTIEAVSRIAWDNYLEMLDDGISKEVARMVLPTNLYSSAYITMNSRSLFNFFKLRMTGWGSKPQWEIRLLAQEMFACWQSLFPETARIFVGTESD